MSKLDTLCSVLGDIGNGDYWKIEPRVDSVGELVVRVEPQVFGCIGFSDESLAFALKDPDEAARRMALMLAGLQRDMIKDLIMRMRSQPAGYGDPGQSARDLDALRDEWERAESGEP